jgi:hypothetical protein
MIHGSNLIEYTSEELNVLLDAVASYTIDFRMQRIQSGSNGPSKTIEILDQWAVKIIEARIDVRREEITQSN